MQNMAGCRWCGHVMPVARALEFSIERKYCGRLCGENVPEKEKHLKYNTVQSRALRGFRPRTG